MKWCHRESAAHDNLWLYLLGLLVFRTCKGYCYEASYHGINTGSRASSSVIAGDRIMSSSARWAVRVNGSAVFPVTRRPMRAASAVPAADGALWSASEAGGRPGAGSIASRIMLLHCAKRDVGIHHRSVQSSLANGSGPWLR